MQKKISPKIIFVIGVSGSGKSSVGKLLAKEINFLFIDADDHHPKSNIEKMSNGIPLNDNDRKPWLNTLNQIAKDNIDRGCVIACSALKQTYRKRLSHSLPQGITWVYLKGDYELILNRMRKRKGHFMDSNMLKSQFDILEEPKEAIVMNIEASTEKITQNLKTLFLAEE